MDTQQTEAIFLLNRIRKTLCYLCNHPDHKDKVSASSAAVADIDHYLEMHGPTAHELMQAMSGLSHFDQQSSELRSSGKGKSNEQ